MKYFFLSILLFALFIFSTPQISFAQGIFSKSVSSSCSEKGDCNPEEIIDLVDGIVKWGAAVTGSIALLMYILGGTWMLFSSGSSSRVERGKNIITGTTIALIFILGSWLIIDFTLTALKTKELEIEARQETPAAYYWLSSIEECIDTGGGLGDPEFCESEIGSAPGPIANNPGDTGFICCWSP